MPGMGLLELCHRRLQLRVGLREHRYHLQEQFALLVLPSLEQLTLFSLLAHYLLELLPLLLLLTQHLLLARAMHRGRATTQSPRARSETWAPDSCWRCPQF